MEQLSRVNFFDKYIFEPFSNDLSTGSKIANFVLSLAFLIFTVGTVHAYCYFTAKPSENTEQDVKVYEAFQRTIDSPRCVNTDVEQEYLDGLKKAFSPKPQAQPQPNPAPVNPQPQPAPVEPQIQEAELLAPLKDLKFDSPMIDPKQFGLVVENGEPLAMDAKKREAAITMTSNIISKAVNKKEFATLTNVDVPKDLKIKLYKGDNVNSQNLGQFDVLETMASMTFDKDWKHSVGRQNKFFVHQAAGIYEPYVHEESFVRDMGVVFNNILKAQNSNGVVNAVWEPFAFVQGDAQDQQAYFNLKKQLASMFFEQVAKFPNIQIHLSLAANSESFNAYASALALSKVKGQVTLHANADAASLAQKLANNGNKSGLVSFTNSRTLSNEFWVAPAIAGDSNDNLLRRSTLVALSTMILSKAQVFRPAGFFGKREEQSLAERVLYFGGSVED